MTSSLSPSARLRRSGWIALAILWLLGACASPTPTTTPPAPTPTTPPTVTPTPLPAILRVPLSLYEAPHAGFSLQAPEDWPGEAVGGGMQFRSGEEAGAVITAYFQPLPESVDPADYLMGVISQTIEVVQFNDNTNFELLSDATDGQGHRRLEFLGQLDPEQPRAHLLAELWTEASVLVGVSLHGPAGDWAQIEPLWPLLRQSYVLGDVPRARERIGLSYVHPSGHFALTVPVGWGIVAESNEGVLFGETGGLAQYQISFAEWERRPSLQDLNEALAGLLGDLPEQASYEELARAEDSTHERMVRFENLAAENGFYRSELRAFASGDRLFTTSFSAPPHLWATFEPAYELLRASLQLSAPQPPDEATQDADPIAGIQVGPTLFYRARGGSLWVSAPIHNYRTRHLEDLTAAVQLFDAADQLLVAESWRLQQRILGAGETTYLSMRLPPEGYPLDEVSYALVKVVNATDTEQEPLQPWGYVGGTADVNANGDVVLNVTMRNASNDLRNRLYLVGLMYDAEGRLVFARGEIQYLRRNIAPGETINLELVVWGQLSGVNSFDMVGEVPR